MCFEQDTAEDLWLLSLGTKEAVDVLLNGTSYPCRNQNAYEDESNNINSKNKQACLDLQAIAISQEKELFEETEEHLSDDSSSDRSISPKLPSQAVAAHEAKSTGQFKASYSSQQDSHLAPKEENSQASPMFLQHRSSGYACQQHKQLEHSTGAQQQQLMQKSQQEEQPKLLLQQKQKLHLRQQHLQLQQQHSYAFKAVVQEEVICVSKVFI